MQIAIIPPEYFPRQRIAALALQVDRLVLADTFPFQRRSFQNRTKIRTPQGWHWARIPTFGRQRGKAILEVDIEHRERWITKHWRSLQFNYRSTPYFELYEPHIESYFDQEWQLLGAATCRSMEIMLGLLDYDDVLVRASSLQNAPHSIQTVIGALDVEVSQVLLSEDQERPDVEPVEVFRLHYDEPQYEQNFEGFEKGMTAFDLIFNHGPDSVRMMNEASRIDDLE